jgi:hypothetical protein
MIACEEMESRPLRRAWTEEISGQDYEAHMARVGQAQANAELVRSVLEKWPPRGPRLLFAGAGTGQMFEYTGPGFLEPYEVLFTDIRASFLDRLKERLPDADVRVDDLEDTQLEGPFGGVVVVLVLEHIDWRKGVASLTRLRAARYYIVIQENPPTPVAPRLEGTMAALRDAHAFLVPEHELIEAMSRELRFLIGRESRDVMDGKKMIALVFDREST